MKRVNVCISEWHANRLADAAIRTGLAKSDIIRRALEEYWIEHWEFIKLNSDTRQEKERRAE